MADSPYNYWVVDKTTGERKQLPKEAVEAEYKKGNVEFAPGQRLPIVYNGVEGTVPSEEYEEALSNDAKPNFDPSGPAKAAVASTLRTVTLGASDWAGEQVGKVTALAQGRDPKAGGEEVRQILQGLRENNPGADTAGAIVGMLVPGALGLAGKIAKGAVAADEVAEAVPKIIGESAPSEAADAAKHFAQSQQATQAAQAATVADAATGATKGSVLSQVARYANPYNFVEDVGGLAEKATEGLPLGRFISPVARWGTEGALIGAASAVDESELGDTQLTGEALWTSIDHGALFGSALGVVGTGLGKVGSLLGSAAGRIANRLGEASLGGTPGQYGRALDRWGPGGLGFFAHEVGLANPLLSAEKRYELAENIAKKFGEHLEAVVKDADESYNGASVRSIRESLHRAIDESTEKVSFTGGNGKAMADKLKSEFDAHVGWKEPPERQPGLPPDTADRLYEQKVEQAGIPKENELKPPEAVRPIDVNRRWRQLAEEAGLGIRPEKAGRMTPEYLAAYQQELLHKFNMGSVEEKRTIGTLLANPNEVKIAAKRELEEAVVSRNAQRVALRERAANEVQSAKAAEEVKYRQLVDAHQQLKAEAVGEVLQHNQEAEQQYTHLSRAANKANDNLKISLSHARDWRIRVDQAIPYEGTDKGMKSALSGVKFAARNAVEGAVEKEMDGLAKQGRPDLMPAYLHAKGQYGLAKDALRMTKRARNSAAKGFGHVSYFGLGGHVAGAIAAATTGHPAFLGAGLAGSVARHFGPGIASWAMHRATRLAEIKAIKAEVEIATRRAVRSAVSPAFEGASYATIRPDFGTPHQMRMTAAEAMQAVSKLGDNKLLSTKLAALDPSTPIVAPAAAAAHEATAQRMITFLISQIPAHAKAQLMTDGQIDHNSLSDVQSREYLSQMAVVRDPRIATDALANGTITTGMIKAYRAGYPGLNILANATIQRQKAMDKATFDRLPRNKKAALETFQGPGVGAGLTSMLQANASAFNSTQGQTTGKGMSHASAGLSKSPMGTALETQSQMIEAGPPGRRGRRGGSAISGM